MISDGVEIRAAEESPFNDDGSTRLGTDGNPAPIAQSKMSVAAEAINNLLSLDLGPPHGPLGAFGGGSNTQNFRRLLETSLSPPIRC